MLRQKGIQSWDDGFSSGFGEDGKNKLIFDIFQPASDTSSSTASLYRRRSVRASSWLWRA